MREGDGSLSATQGAAGHDLRAWPPGNAGEAVDVVAERAGAPPPSSPVKLSGSIPPLAESFHQRPETGLDLRAGLYPGDTVVLTHGEESPAAPAPGRHRQDAARGGVHPRAVGARAVEALVWVPASSRDAIVTGFAQAASTVGAADPGLGAEAAADLFVTWLAHTRRPWALILDDLASLDDLAGLWPTGPAGQVVITTRLPEAAFRALRTGAPGAFGSHGAADTPMSPGGLMSPGGPRVARVGGFSRREVLAYLGARLAGFPDQRADSLDLGADLDGLPLALAQAAAVMTVTGLSCREYRDRFGERREHCPRSGSPASHPPRWPPGRWPRRARTNCRPPGRPGRPALAATLDPTEYPPPC